MGIETARQQQKQTGARSPRQHREESSRAAHRASAAHEGAGQRSPRTCGNTKPFPIEEALRRLRRAAKRWQAPVVTLMAQQNRSPFHVLIGCLLSLRTKDEVTARAAQRLFQMAGDPYALSRLPDETIARAIYPVGFYRNKARVIRDISRVLVEKYNGEVPADLEALLTLKGVGRKTANLVLSQGFGLPAICVDTHVHRISNRWGFVCSKTPDETERQLRAKLPKRYWVRYNELLVAFGQTICRPISPLCSKCPVENLCPKKGVRRHR